MARLFVLSGASIGTTLDLEGTSVIGRGDDADLVVREPSISRKHARLVPREEPGVWKVIDLDSSNGVHVGGKRVRTAILHDGETFVLGDIELRLRDESGAAQGDTTPPVRIEAELEFEPDPGTGPSTASGTAPDHGSDSAAKPAPPAAGTDELELELEFGDDIDTAISAAPKSAGRSPSAASPPRSPSAPPGHSAAAASANRSGARATQQRDTRRKAALGGGPRATGGSSVTATATGNAGKPVLQYAQTRRAGTDIRQLPGWTRALVIAAALAVAGGIAYGAFTLTRTARSQASSLVE